MNASVAQGQCCAKRSGPEGAPRCRGHAPTTEAHLRARKLAHPYSDFVSKRRELDSDHTLPLVMSTSCVRTKGMLCSADRVWTTEIQKHLQTLRQGTHYSAPLRVQESVDLRHGAVGIQRAPSMPLQFACKQQLAACVRRHRPCGHTWHGAPASASSSLATAVEACSQPLLRDWCIPSINCFTTHITQHLLHHGWHAKHVSGHVGCQTHTRCAHQSVLSAPCRAPDKLCSPSAVATPMCLHARY